MGSRWTMKKRKDDLGPESERTLLARDRSSLASRLMHCVWTSPWPRGLPSRGSASVPRVLTAAAGQARACGEGVRHSALGKKGEESMLQASLETQDGTFQKIRGCADWRASEVPFTLWSTSGQWFPPFGVRELFLIMSLEPRRQYLRLKWHITERKGYDKCSDASKRTHILPITTLSLYFWNTAIYTSYMKNYSS